MKTANGNCGNGYVEVFMGLFSRVLIGCLELPSVTTDLTPSFGSPLRYTKNFKNPSTTGTCTGHYAYDDDTCDEGCIVVCESIIVYPSYTLYTLV